MTKALFPWFLYVAFIIATACQSSDMIEVNVAHEVEAIKKVIHTDYINAVNAHDTSAYAKLFADNIIWVPADFLATSKTEIKNALQKNFDASELKLTPGSIEIDVRGDFAYAFSTDFILNKRPREGDEESIKYASAIWLLKKQDGEWKIFRQVYNTRDF